MKLTPQRLMQNFGRGVAVESSRQHCSRVATRGPEREPSTLRKTFPRLFSVVILNMWIGLAGREECKENANQDLNLLQVKLLFYLRLKGKTGHGAKGEMPALGHKPIY